MHQQGFNRLALSLSMLCSPGTNAHTWTGLPAPSPLGMSAVSLCLVVPAGRKLPLDACPDCILQLRLPGRPECGGLSGTCLIINKTDTWVSFWPLFGAPSPLARFSGEKGWHAGGLPWSQNGKIKAWRGGNSGSVDVSRQRLTKNNSHLQLSYRCSWSRNGLPQFRVGAEQRNIQFWMQIPCANL